VFDEKSGDTCHCPPAAPGLLPNDEVLKMTVLPPVAKTLSALAFVSVILTACSTTPPAPETDTAKWLVPQNNAANDLNNPAADADADRGAQAAARLLEKGPIKVLRPAAPSHYNDEPLARHKSYSDGSLAQLGTNKMVAYAPINNKRADIHLPNTYAGKRPVLFIGDSHSTAVFGATLTNLIEQEIPGAQVTAIASCGSSPDWWLNGNKATRCGFWRHNADGSEEKGLRGMTPQVDELLSSLQPQTVIVALGANLIPQHQEERILQTETLMRQVAGAGRQCFWIGPPDARKFTSAQTDEVYVLLDSLAHSYNCQLIDSRKYTHYPSSGRDGLHYSGKEGEAIARSWATQIFQNHLQNGML
jgi:hypothetical protein